MATREVFLQRMKSLTLQNIQKAADRFAVSHEITTRMCDLIRDAGQYCFLVWWWQVSWSLSPFMHTYNAVKQNLDFGYMLRDMDQFDGSIQEVMDKRKQDSMFLGGNITMPYKLDVYEYMLSHALCDDEAYRALAVNTVVARTQDMIGYNTDIMWIVRPIQHTFASKKQDVPEHAVILGAWGAAKAAVVACLKLWMKHICIANRTTDEADLIIKHMRHFIEEDVVFESIEYNVTKNPLILKKYLTSPSIVISSLPFGFKPSLPQSSMSFDVIDACYDNIIAVFDLVYDINASYTPLTKYITQKYPDIHVCTGQQMVVHQAKYGFEMRNLWSDFDTKELEDLFQKASD